MDHFLIGGGFGEKLQNRELEELIPIRVVAEKLAHPLVVAVERIHIVPPTAQKVHGGQVKIGILPGEPIGVWKTDGHHIRRVRHRGADLIQCIKLSVVSCVADKNGPVGIAAAEIGLLLTGILQDHIFLIAAAKALVRKGMADEFDFSGGKADLGQEV